MLKLFVDQTHLTSSNFTPVITCVYHTNYKEEILRGSLCMFIITGNWYRDSEDADYRICGNASGSGYV